MSDARPQTDAPRLMRRVGTATLLSWLGAAVLVVAFAALSPPGSDRLFAPDGDTLPPHVAVAFDRARLVTGVVGLLLVAVGCRSRGAQRPSPVRYGDVVLTLVAAVVGLIAVDAALRVRGARVWGSAVRTPLSLSAMRPGQALVPLPGVYAQQPESDFDPAPRPIALFTINRFGLRGPLPEVPKPAGQVRIVCLGGSTTFGMSVTDGSEWPAELGRLLGSEVEVVNAGRPGATTYRDYAYLRDRLLQLEPDAVVLYEGFNDMWRGLRRHAGEQPDYGVVAEGLPAADEVLDLGPPRRWPWRPSFLTYHVGQKLDHWLKPSRPSSPRPERGDGPFVFDPPIVAMYEQNLGALVRLCRGAGVVPVVATFAGCDDPTRPADEQRRRLAYVLREMPVLDVASATSALDLYREVTRKVARAEGVLLVDLAAAMTRDLGAYTDTVHFTPEGESQLAGLVAGALRDAGLLAPGPGGPEGSS